MCVTHQDNLIIQFSDNVCDKSSKLCHRIIPFYDNVCDISGKPPCQIFWQCVWHIRMTVSLYHPIFRQCLWHIRPTTLSKVATEKKKGKKEESNWRTGGHYIVASQRPNGDQLQRRRSCQFSENVCDVSQELYQFIIPFSDNVRDISKSYYFLAIHDV